MEDVNVTIKLLKLKQKKIYLQGIIDGMEWLEDHIRKHYLDEEDKEKEGKVGWDKISELSFSTKLYIAGEDLSSFYICQLEEVELEIEELLEKDKEYA